MQDRDTEPLGDGPAGRNADSATGRESGIRRLEAALAIWIEYRTDPNRDAPTAWLARHEDLRDLLEPFLADDTADDGLDPGLQFADGAFRILGPLGRGGAATVYDALQLSLDRRVALKVLSPDTAPRAIARFKREALTAARLEHPGIVDVHTVGESDGLHWMAMELIDGGTLDDWAQRVRLEDPNGYVRRVVTTITAVADALDHAHRAGVVHRDIKPTNVLMRRSGQPVVTDFGIARESALPSVTRSGEFAGTANYMSPEQARGEHARVDARSDVFSLGVTLYELLTGDLPFDGSSTADVLHAIQRDHPRSVDRIDTRLPRSLGAIVARTLEKEPDARYATAAELAEDLRAFLDHRPIRARHPSSPERLVRWVRREPLRATLASGLAIALGLATVLGANLWSQRSAFAVGDETLRRDRVDELLLAIAIEKSEETTDVTRERVLAAARLADDDPAVIGLVAGYLSSRRGVARADARREALAYLADRDHVVQRSLGLLRLRHAFLEDVGDIEAARSIEPLLTDEARMRHGGARDPVDCWVCAKLAMKRWAKLGGDDARAAAEDARRLARQAIRLTDQPRAEWLLLLKTAAIACGDKEEELATANALVHHWPDSATAWAHKAMAWQSVDPETAREAAFESYRRTPSRAMVLVLGRLAVSTGDDGAAQHWFRELRDRYPGLDMVDGFEQPHDSTPATDAAALGGR